MKTFKELMKTDVEATRMPMEAPFVLVDGVTGPTRMQIQKHFDKEKGLLRARITATEKAFKISNMKVDAKGTVQSFKEEVEVDEKKSHTGYELYHKDFSSAMQHAYKFAKSKGHVIDPKEIDDKVATGPKKPSSGKTNRYSLKAGRKKVEIQVANLDNKRYELNMYIEGVELDELYKDYPGKGHLMPEDRPKIKPKDIIWRSKVHHWDQDVRSSNTRFVIVKNKGKFSMYAKSDKSGEIVFHFGDKPTLDAAKEFASIRKWQQKREEVEHPEITYNELKSIIGKKEEVEIEEGTWALPDTQKKYDKLMKLMQRKIPAGKATKILYNFAGDDALFDAIGEKEKEDKNGDVRPMVNHFLDLPASRKYMKKHGIKGVFANKEEVEIDEANLNDYAAKFKQKMGKTTYQTMTDWVDGIGKLTKRENKTLKRVLKPFTEGVVIRKVLLRLSLCGKGINM